MGSVGCPETFVKNYYYTPLILSEESRSHLLRGGILKSYMWLNVNPKYISRKAAEFFTKIRLGTFPIGSMKKITYRRPK